MTSTRGTGGTPKKAAAAQKAASRRAAQKAAPAVQKAATGATATTVPAGAAATVKLSGIAIKTVLLDQSVLAGVGNIYADEGLFMTGIRPMRRADKVTAAQCEALVAALQKVMLRSIETGGSSISDYVRPDGSDGGYQDERRVYARTGEPCSKCGTAIQRLVIATRSSHFCPSCQR